MKKLFLIISTLILVGSCVDSDSITDYEQGINYGKSIKDTLIATESKFYEYGKVTTGFSTKLLLGTYNNYECRYLVKFSRIPADTIDVDSVYFLIQAIGKIGNAGQDIPAEIKLVTKSWNENVNADDDWSYLSDVSNSPTTTTLINFDDNDTLLYSFAIPDTIVSIWQDTVGGNKNHGLFVDYQSADFVKAFSSENSNIAPKIVYVYQNASNDSTIRDTVAASIDATVLEYPSNTLVSDSLLFVTAGFAHRALIKFNLDSIPKNIKISSANLILKQDTSASLLDKSGSNSFYVRTVKSAFSGDPVNMDVDSTFLFNINYSISLSADTLHNLETTKSYRGGMGQYFIQSIIDGNIEYGSFLIHYVGEGNTISQFAIKGANQNIKLENRPKLILEYIELPDSRI